MFKVTVEGETLGEVISGLRQTIQALGETLAADGAGATGSVGTKVSQVKAKPAPEPEEDEDEAPPPKAKAKAKPAPADDSELTYDDDVRPAVVAFSKKYGRDPMLEALGAFTDPATDEPATHAQQLDADDWARFLKSMKKIGARIDAED